MLANLRALQILGKCRELSVFDFIDGVPVHGIIVCPNLLLYSEFIHCPHRMKSIVFHFLNQGQCFLRRKSENGGLAPMNDRPQHPSLLYQSNTLQVPGEPRGQPGPRPAGSHSARHRRCEPMDSTSWTPRHGSRGLCP